MALKGCSLKIPIFALVWNYKYSFTISKLRFIISQGLNLVGFKYPYFLDILSPFFGQNYLFIPWCGGWACPPVGLFKPPELGPFKRVYNFSSGRPTHFSSNRGVTYFIFYQEPFFLPTLVKEPAPPFDI